MKVVINNDYGGFSISKECAEFMAKLGHKQAQAELDEWNKNNKAIQFYLKTGKWENKKDAVNLDIDAKYSKQAKFYGYGYIGKLNGYKRDDPLLVKAVEELKEKANGGHASLKVVEIPDETDYTIEEYDGSEHIAERHQTWY
jgi:hypothetical protein